MNNEINAFHPDFVKTHMPEFMAAVRTESKQTTIGQNVSKYVEKKRKTAPSHGTVLGISKKILPAHMNRPKEMIKPHIRSKSEQGMTMKEVTEELIEKLKNRSKK